MKRTPNSFRTDLQKAYIGKITLDSLIKKQERFLRSLAKYALRFKTAWFLNDEDDLFQEACIWLVRSLWEWDETKNIDLCTYVIYNIGARLGNQTIRTERAQKRHPNPNTSRKINIWDTYDDESHYTYEETMRGVTYDPETTSIINEALDKANKQMTNLAKELFISLIQNNGNLMYATRDMIQRDHIKRRFGTDEYYLRYVLGQKIMPEISNIFHPTNIINENKV